jgi:cellulose synthase (UDP-forming)
VLVTCVAAFVFFEFISLFLSWPKQMVLGVATILAALAINRLSASRAITIALMLFSIAATFRYAWWRVHLLVDFFADESNKRISLDTFFLLLLISAEAYTILIMILGYMQTAWPLRRKPLPMPADEDLWPHVDVLIPTYNEALSLVRYTVLAAINIDYPPEKLHVYILDDGTRKEFKEFAYEAGIGYITRREHEHAKAGNINHALTLMRSPYVAIFDCDHVPTRSFLQMTLGWMLADPLLAMLQTPHHFYSPDPFERNLLQYKTIPSEADLFYGIVQDGNDFWNATFFCGSCALMRRSALDEVGGIAVETVTEDAHTSLRMQKRGYNTAYINIPQAAGLATETLSAHVGQRVRWARGMIQILRIDNPLFGGGLKFAQRLCYFNAMAHFLYAVPRLVFLLAPLVYLLLGRTIIPGYWLAILAYALPHLILSNLTNSRIQGRHRHSFWNEIYEAVLAPYILAPTLLAMINPKLGKFNVTDKGSTLQQTQFDRRIAAPTRWMLLLNFMGLLASVYRLMTPGETPHTGAVVMNMVWVVFNIVILGVAGAVAMEQKQRRESVRIEARIPVRLDLAGGRRLEGVTTDMSVGGASVRVNGDEEFAVGQSFRLAFPEIAGDADQSVAARVAGMGRGVIRLSFSLPTIVEQEVLTRALYSRADAWIDSLRTKEVDRPLVSLGRVIRLSAYGIYQICRSYFPGKSEAKNTRAAQTAALILIACMVSCCGQAFARGLRNFAVAGIGASSPPTLAAKTKTRQGWGTQHWEGFGELASATRGWRVSQLAWRSDGRGESNADNAAQAEQTMSLKDLGQQGAIEMRGPHSYYSVRFTLSHALVPRQATLRLFYSIDPGLDPRATSLRVNLNGTAIATLTTPRAADIRNGFAPVDLMVPDALLVRSNVVTFEFTGSGVMQREEQARAKILCRIGQASTLTVSGDRFRLNNDLSQLPLPVFDSDLESGTTVPFVFVAEPSPRTLQAAGVVASWLGLSAGTRPVRFSVALGQIPAGNAVIFSANRGELAGMLQMPSGSGPVIAMTANPSDPYGSVLVVAGDDENQLLMAARTLAMAGKPGAPGPGAALAGETMQVQELTLPTARARDDAPRWLAPGKAEKLASCQLQEALESDGSSAIPVYFHVAPDLFYGEKQNLDLHLFYRYDARPVAAGSALRVVVNGLLVSEIPLAPGADFAEGRRVIPVPVADLRPFGNTMLFNFDFVPSNRDAAQAAPLSGAILCNSFLDLKGLKLWTAMPNLELFANAGFPFTQLADLGATTVVLPAVPSVDEIALYLHLMGHFGAQTGYPALRVSVEGPSAVISGGRDYLIVGTVADQPAFNSLDPLLPVTLNGSGVHVKPEQGFAAWISRYRTAIAKWWASLRGLTVTENLPGNEGGLPDALVEEIESPASQDRSIVLVELRQDASAESFASVLLDRSQSTDMTGPLSLLRGGRFESYALEGATYHLGNISWYARMRIWMAQHFLLLLFAVTAFSFVVAYWIYGWMAWHARVRLIRAESPSVEE